MCEFAHSPYSGPALIVMAVLVDTVSVISRGDEVDVVAVAATGMAGDAIQDLGAVQEVADVLLHAFKAGAGRWSSSSCRSRRSAPTRVGTQYAIRVYSTYRMSE